MTAPAARLALRPLTADDAAAIAAWPAYPAEFAELDYALRRQGWLAEFRGQPQATLFAAELSGDLIAFTLLAMDAAGAAEFRIALHPAWAARGWGGRIAELTLQFGFADCRLQRIHLIVRQSNQRAIALYRRLGFVDQGACCRDVNGRATAFFRMELRRRDRLPLS